MSAKLPLSEDIKIGQLLRVRRISIGLSQADLAKALGISFQQVQKYEQGLNRIGAGRIARLAKILEVSPIYFFPSEKALPADNFLAEVLSNQSSVRLALAFARIEETELRNAVVELVEAISSAEPRNCRKRSKQVQAALPRDEKGTR